MKTQREKKLEIALLKEKIERISGKKVLFKENKEGCLIESKTTGSLSPGDKVIVSLNGVKTGEGIVVNPKEAGFPIKRGNVAVKIIKTLHSVAKKGIFQFSKSNIKRLSS